MPTLSASPEELPAHYPMLKNSETEPLRKSRIRAPRVTSADTPYGKAYVRVAGGNAGLSAEPLKTFTSRLPAAFSIVIEAKSEFFNIG